MAAPTRASGSLLVLRRIRTSLNSILGRTPCPAAVDVFVRACVAMATAHVRRRVGAGTLRPGFIGLNPEDCALDCVASLFARDHDGRFPQLERYYGRLDWMERTDEELLSLTRRLVFSRVNQEFCRLCKETDPSLERVIRNIRNAVRTVPGFALERRLGEVWVLCVPNGVASVHTLPAPVLERELVPHLHSGITIPQVVKAVGAILMDQDQHAHGYPLTDLALVIRSAFGRMGCGDAAVRDEHSAGMHEEELRSLLGKVVAGVEQDMRHWYLDSSRMDPETFRQLFLAVEDILAADYLDGADGEMTFYDYCAKRLPGLTLQMYILTCRSRLEYFVKRSRRRFLEVLRSELTPGGGPAVKNRKGHNDAPLR